MLSVYDRLMDLITEKLYMDISVTDIVTRAGVARASFYRNFNSIDDVINAISDEILEELIEDLSPIILQHDERKCRKFLFNHFYRIESRHDQIKKIRFENMSIIFNKNEEKIQKMKPLLKVIP